ncbi:hypothetical protein [Gardnerella vaginalis]|uniref:hypothetical protein n=1 Tax=Gardnerella vaginalis TaxID=2702 RepID=UPI0039F0A23C
MIDGINRALNTDCGVNTTKVLELIAKYRNALDQEEDALNKVKEAECKCQALQKAEQAVRDTHQKYCDAVKERRRQQDKFNENNAELVDEIDKTADARRDALTQLLNEIGR